MIVMRYSDETVGLIYEAALDPALWPAVLTSTVLSGDGVDTSLTGGPL
jgi:hypothetical protein